MLASLIVVILCIHTSCGAKLYFRNNEEFKIAIFADCRLKFSIIKFVNLAMILLVHFGEGENTEWGPQQDVVSIKMSFTIMVASHRSQPFTFLFYSPAHQ